MATRQFRTAGTSALKPPPPSPTTRIESLGPGGGCVFRIDNSDSCAPFTASEIESARKILAELKDSDVLLDIGAGSGLLSVHAAKMGARVFAMEPDPATRARLRENLRLNDVKHPEVLAWSASDSKGYLAYSSPATPTEVQRIVITTNTIDDALHRNHIAAPTVICLRASREAHKAICGMCELLKSPRRPRLVIIQQSVAAESLPPLADEILRAACYAEAEAAAPDIARACRIYRHGAA
jgi:FkbM family methyltransferase